MLVLSPNGKELKEFERKKPIDTENELEIVSNPSPTEELRVEKPIVKVNPSQKIFNE